MNSRTQRLALLITVLVLAMLFAFLAFQREAPPPASEPFSHHTAERSSHWPVVRAEYLKDHPYCEVCGPKQTTGLEVHHVKPFHDNPSLELDKTNLVVLCGHTTKYNHHFWFGHLGDWKASNPNVREWIKAIQDRKEE